MGQQQLLLIVLGVIIVGIAIAVGISMFKSNSQSSNRDALVNDLNNLAAQAQQYYRKPTSMGGGAQKFDGFGLAAADTGNGNGSYFLKSGSSLDGTYQNPPTRHLGGNGFDTLSAGTNVQSFLIVGIGNELGNSGTSGQMVEAEALVTRDGPTVKVLN